jgi:hypothetical protein
MSLLKQCPDMSETEDDGTSFSSSWSLGGPSSSTWSTFLGSKDLSIRSRQVVKNNISRVLQEETDRLNENDKAYFDISAQKDVDSHSLTTNTCNSWASMQLMTCDRAQRALMTRRNKADYVISSLQLLLEEMELQEVENGTENNNDQEIDYDQKIADILKASASEVRSRAADHVRLCRN